MRVTSSTRSHPDFYPRSPCGERRVWAFPDGSVCLFLSTLSLRRATHYDNYNLHCTEISIHALLAESDVLILSYEKATKNFYPRSPCGERPQTKQTPKPTKEISIHALLAESDWDWFFTGTLNPKFLSTLSLRRATSNGGTHYSYIRISIHALLAESDCVFCSMILTNVISIHALLAESDA